jgi:hypothetical protein
MYLRITRARFDPANYDQIVPVARDLDAAMRQLPGLQQFWQGVDRAAGTVAAVSTWDTEEHANVAREALGEPVGRLRALGVTLDPLEIYELLDSGGPTG